MPIKTQLVEALTADKHNRITLEPLVEIPAREKWLFNNKHALQQVEQGLKESAKGQTKSK